MDLQMRVFQRPAVYILNGVLLLASIACGSDSPTAPTTPNINGQWTGTYSVLSCIESGAAVGVACAPLAGGGPHRLTPSQSGTNVTAQLGIGGFNIPVTGSVDVAGVVTLAGTGPVSVATLTVNNWRGVIAGNSMTGTMSYTVFAVDGSFVVTSTFTLSK